MGKELGDRRKFLKALIAAKAGLLAALSIPGAMAQLTSGGAGSTTTDTSSTDAGSTAEEDLNHPSSLLAGVSGEAPDSEDAIFGNRVSGRVSGTDEDEYYYTGSLERAEFEEGVRVFIDGEEVDPSDIG